MQRQAGRDQASILQPLGLVLDVIFPFLSFVFASGKNGCSGKGRGGEGPTLAPVADDAAVTALEHHAACTRPLQRVVGDEEAAALAAPVLQVAILPAAVKAFRPGVQPDLTGSQLTQLRPAPQSTLGVRAAGVVRPFHPRHHRRPQILVAVGIARDRVPRLLPPGPLPLRPGPSSNRCRGSQPRAVRFKVCAPAAPAKAEKNASRAEWGLAGQGSGTCFGWKRHALFALQQ